ncbi:activating transcription factor 7-interacting protein 2 [Polypterus senegalus]|uniref:activating transcription factor 7-interacting protein 2 n=1 Tax=Polypterus senegalus TaxID=55291 RepID=UPI001962C691|nr:activating transcription factor 7-interacting protein 2 [Polypterus senegalus]
MENANGILRKIFKAKKTMPSCNREQFKHLSTKKKSVGMQMPERVEHGSILPRGKLLHDGSAPSQCFSPYFCKSHMEEFGDTINSPVAKSDFPLDKPLKSETADPLPVDRDREGNMANGQKENSSQGEKNPLQKDIWKCSKLSSLGDDMDVNCNVTRSTHGQGAIKLDKDEEDGLMPILFKMALKHDLGDYVFDGSREAVFENVSEYQRVQGAPHKRKFNVDASLHKHLKNSSSESCEVDALSLSSRIGKEWMVESIQKLIKHESVEIGKQFESKFEELGDRIKKIECNIKHELVLFNIQKKIDKLKRRLQSALSVQEQSAVMKMNDSSAIAVNKDSGAATSGRQMPSSSCNAEVCRYHKGYSATKNNEKHSSCLSSIEFADEVIFCGIVKTGASDNDQRKSACPSRNRSHLAMIDLTADQPEVEHLSPLTPAAIGSAGESTFHHKGKIKSIFPIPPLPEISIPSNLPSIAAMSNLPPKMQIRIAKIKNPDAIGVLWDIKYVNQNAAPMQSYHLYILYEDCNGNISPWKNIASVKALPLPAACQFTGYRSAKRICFSIIGRDVYGRFGPYSDVQSIIFKRSYQ